MKSRSSYETSFVRSISKFLISLHLVGSVYCNFKSSSPDVFLEKGILEVQSKFTGERLCRSAISINLFCHFIEIILRHGCSPLNLLHILRAPFSKNTTDVHTKTRNKLERVGTIWNELEPTRTSWNQMEQPKTRTRKIQGSQLQWQWLVAPICIRKKI